MKQNLILCYHQVSPDAQTGRHLNIHPDRLDDHVKFFIRRRRKFVLPNELPYAGSSVTLTFDDAFVSALLDGRDILNRSGIKGAFYAVAGKVGGLSDWEGGGRRELADWGQLCKAQEEGHEVGNHSSSHASMPTLSDGEQQGEWVEAHGVLIEHGIRPRTACYPYGHFSPYSRRHLAALDYNVALSIEKWPGGDDVLRLARIVVAYGDALPLLLYRIHVRPLLRKRPKLAIEEDSQFKSD